jgi:hypothetical protein
MDKLIMNGTEYELDYNGPCDSTNTPEILFKGRAYIGKAVKNKPTKDYEIIERYNYGEVPCDGDIAPIKSVKRLSDNEVFSCGEKVFIAGENRPISRIWIEPNLGTCYVTTPIRHSWTIASLKKVKLPLFTTTDGKEIFEDQTVFYVNFTYKMHEVSSKEVWLQFLSEKEEAVFSTREDAEAYVIENNPCLSLKDIYSVWAISPKERTPIEELVKRKLASS